MTIQSGTKRTALETAAYVAHEAVDTAQAYADSANDAATEVYAIGKKRALRAQGKIRNYVKRNPYKSLLFAAGAGAIAGAILFRRSPKN